MTRSEMRTAIQATGFGSASTDTTQQNNWLAMAEAWVWNAAGRVGRRWSFARVTDQSLTVAASDSSPTMPTAFSRALAIYDHNGAPLTEMSPIRFDELFRESIADSQTEDPPYAFMQVDRQVYLGPTPGASRTFKLDYERYLCHRADGSTITAGAMNSDNDTPVFPAEHHMIVVYHAAMVGHALSSNPMAVTMQTLRDDALSPMLEDLAESVPRAGQWGAWAWA